jgi:hypothetical protein
MNWPPAVAKMVVVIEIAVVEFTNGHQSGVRLRKASATKDPAINDEAALPATLKKDEPYDGSPL